MFKQDGSSTSSDSLNLSNSLIYSSSSYSAQENVETLLGEETGINNNNNNKSETNELLLMMNNNDQSLSSSPSSSSSFTSSLTNSFRNVFNFKQQQQQSTAINNNNITIPISTEITSTLPKPPSPSSLCHYIVANSDYISSASNSLKFDNDQRKLFLDHDFPICKVPSERAVNFHSVTGQPATERHLTNRMYRI